MRTLMAIGVVATLVLGATVSTAFAATLVQSEINEIFTKSLKLELVPPANGKVGGPMTYKVTEKSLKQIGELKKPIEVDNAGPNGSIIRDALKKLGFKDVSEEGKPGSPYKVKATKKTVEKLKGKSITVDGEGKVKLQDAKK